MLVHPTRRATDVSFNETQKITAFRPMYVLDRFFFSEFALTMVQVTWDEYSFMINGKRLMLFSGEVHPYR